MTSGDPNGYFSIDPDSGVIRTAGALDHDTVPSVLLNIQAQSGQPPTYGQAQVGVGHPDSFVPSISVIVTGLQSGF